MSDDGHIILDVWIAIEKLVSPVPDEGSAKQKDDHRESKCDPQRRNASLFNHRYHHGTVHIQAKRVAMLSIGRYDASVGFSDATEGGIATPSSGGKHRDQGLAILASSQVAFRGEDRFRIGAGNFAHPNPAEAAD